MSFADRTPSSEPAESHSLLLPQGTSNSLESSHVPRQQPTIKRKPVRSQVGSLGDQNVTTIYTSLPVSTAEDLHTNASPTNHGMPHDAIEMRSLISDDDKTQASGISHWIPTALRWPWVLTFILCGVALLIAVVLLHIISFKNHGLVEDNNSLATQFSWRFLPTLLGVAFGLMLLVISDAVRRTEVLARLARGYGASASATICRPPGTWWSDLIDSFPRKRNDRRFSPSMMSAQVAYILGFLILIPLSSTLLGPEDVILQASTTMLRPKIDAKSTLQPRLSGLQYFQVMGHFLQNVTTSPWITNTYTIIPFWLNNEAWPYKTMVQPRAARRQAETYVYHASLVCEPLTLAQDATLFNLTTIAGESGGRILNSTYPFFSAILGSPSGCRYGFLFQSGNNEIRDLREGGVYWSNMSSVNIDFYSNKNLLSPGDRPVLLNSSKECNGADAIVRMQSKGSYGYATSLKGVDLTVDGRLCRTAFTQALVPVTITDEGNGTFYDFDKSHFERSKIAIDSSIINVTNFKESFFSPTWRSYIAGGETVTNRSAFGGPANVLGAFYDFKAKSLMDDPDFVLKMASIQQYSFGEAVQAALGSINTTEAIPGMVSRLSRRVVVVHPVAIVMEVCLSIIILLLCGVLYFSRLSRRSLGVSQDIAFIDTVGNLVLNRHNVSQVSIEQNLSQYKFSVKNELLRIKSLNSADGVITIDLRKLPKSKPRQNILTTWANLALLALLVFVLVAISVLYYYAERGGLYQAAFIYEADLKLSDNIVGKFAPYSILPTVLAVGIGLWLGSLEAVFKVAQPFITLTQNGNESRKSTKLSYQSSYNLWASGRALLHGHWLLALICSGGFLAQALAIALSALWEKEPYLTSKNIALSQPFQLREVPVVSVGVDYFASPYRQALLSPLFQNLTTSWMYSAALQISLNSSQPSWSRDGWSFVPVTISTDITMFKGENATKSQTFSTNTGWKTIAINLTAISAQLHCSPIDQNINTTSWLSKTNLTTVGLWNKTIDSHPWKEGWEITNTIETYSNVTIEAGLPPKQYSVKVYSSSMPASLSPSCCGRDVNQLPREGSIGYWSRTNLGMAGGNYSLQVYTQNLTVKWIVGQAPVTYYPPKFDRPNLIWPSAPKLVMLNCAPHFYTAKVRVTLDVQTLAVQNYSIVDEPSEFFPAISNDFTKRFKNCPGVCSQNFTTSFGSLFIEALIRASQLKYLGGCGQRQICFENDADRTFNFKEPGQNMDYMSRSMLVLANNSISQLLDHRTMAAAANRTFSTFFQHFASNPFDVNGSGGWMFQRPNETLPSDFPPPADGNLVGRLGPSSVTQPVPPVITGTVYREIEALQMSPVAVWLSLAILAWLSVTILLLLIFKHRYFAPLRHRVETIAEVGSFIVEDDQLHDLIRDGNIARIKTNSQVPEQDAVGSRERKTDPREGVL